MEQFWIDAERDDQREAALVRREQWQRWLFVASVVIVLLVLVARYGT